MPSTIIPFIPDILTGVAALLGGIGAVITAYSTHAKWKSKRRLPKVFKNIQNVYHELNHVIANTDCDRALILKTTNGGGSPQLGSPLYSTVCYEVYQKGDDVTSQWKAQPLDKVYIDNLRKLKDIKGGYGIFNAEDFEGSMLETTYKAQGVSFSYVGEIHKTKDAYFYCSFNFTKPQDKLRYPEAEVIRASINNIRNIFKAGL